ncbi:hypothetical protein DFJ58DRAFT_645183, partial [Suillus subalutaceus]|uniref:uncharacterized protein n=1 Tax=Suillus subalutaceus TaxID=48586 RepID=UPI001B87E671
RKLCPATPATEVTKKSARGGHQQGAPNYNKEDISALLTACGEHLPVGAKSWSAIETTFGQWADENSRPARSAKSLELKFKQLVHTTKPTGDAECPPHIEHAHQIDSDINERAGTQDLDDKDIADEVLVISDQEDNLQPKACNPRLGPIARHSVTPAPCASRNSHTPGLELLTTISTSLDPHLQAAQDDEQTARTLQSTQVMSLSNQLRDAHMTINSLRDQLLQAERECSNAERRADHFEMQLQMAQVLRG